MSACTVIVDPEATLEAARSLLEDYGFRHLPVVQEERVVGMLSDRDVRLAGALQALRARRDQREGLAPTDARLVSEVMRTPVHCLPPEASAARAAHDMVRLQIGAVPVVHSDRLVGLVTETDLLRVFVQGCRDHQGWDDLTRFHMHDPLPTVAPETSIDEAFEALDRRIGHLGVMRAGALVGIVSERDLVPPHAALEEARLRGGDVPEHLLQAVEDVMETRVITAEPGFVLSRCAARMLDHRVGSLVMLERGAVAGILVQRDILEAFAQALVGR